MGNNFALVTIYHPEMAFLKVDNVKSNELNFFSKLYPQKLSVEMIENLLTPINILMQLIFIACALFMFYTLYASFFSSISDDEYTTDSEFLISSSLVEAEKEIGSIEDILLGLFILFYFFCWYFYIYFWNILSIYYDILLVIYLLPALYYIIICIPTFLTYDFGIFYLVYLRGVGGYATIASELLFDYIAFVVFYTRLIVQGVRLILMLVVYVSLHDMIYFGLNLYKTFNSVSIWTELSNTQFSLSSISYFFLGFLPIKLIY